MTDKVDSFREEMGLPAKKPKGFDDVEYTVAVNGRWIELALPGMGTLRLEPANAEGLARALKTCALRVRAQRKV